MTKEISDLDKLIQLLDWSEDQDWFDDSFLKSLENATHQPWFKGFSEAQKTALHNMFVKFLN